MFVLIDSHAHLEMKDFDKDRNRVIARAVEAGVRHIITVATTIPDIHKALEIGQKNESIFVSIGIHPHEAQDIRAGDYDQLRALAREKKVVAFGEIGLDFYRNHSPRAIQLTRFRELLRLGKDLGLPIILHDREAHDEILNVLMEEGDGLWKGVFHCFSGDVPLAKKVIQMGFFISIPGTVTFSKATTQQEVVRCIPLEKILLETDCPYLAPEPYRGKRNEPAFIRNTAEKVASLKSLSFEDVCRITSLNARALFGIGEELPKGKIVYPIRNSLYLNLTNRCSNLCTFCAKKASYVVKGHDLELSREPSAEELVQAVGDPQRYQEIVFCGFGEPLLRLETVKTVAAELKKKGARVRIDTDGQANLVYGRNILPELKGLVDAVSVSLNAESPEKYQRLCRSPFGEESFHGILDFIREAKKVIPEVVATIVAMPGVDVEACRRLAEEELGVKFKRRAYDEVG
ncbi:MAG: TatD family nuclease-associated radical SAM protein [Deltaproteobacteria bacterium]|nr:TatD family nuclease-associated radical SAM protein [Deltaproteobacteria bacterium]